MSTLHYDYQPDCVHAGSSHGNYDTLCSFDPDPTGAQEDAVAVVHAKRRPVTCSDCRAIILEARGHRTVICLVAVSPRHHPSRDLG